MSNNFVLQEDKYQNFLKKSLFGEFIITPIQGDAGLRSYFRVNNQKDSYILMDCPPDYSSITPFIEISHYLNNHGVNAPNIITYDVDQGLAIIEDFGDLTLKSFLMDLPNHLHIDVYYKIIDLLCFLQTIPKPKNFKIFDNSLLISELSLFTEYYVKYELKRNLTNNELGQYHKIWQEILNKQVSFAKSITLRDFHTENIMYLENNERLSKFGILDFQDALIGSPIYDLVSILEDARIEVPRDLALTCLQYFAILKKLPLEDVLVNYHILGAQRNSRILGIFSRKAIRDQDNAYLQYIPLVKKYLNYNLSHELMNELRYWHHKLLNH